MAEKKEEMKRRDFLFKAAEAAALALFGGMGLAEVVKKVKEQLAEREILNRLSEATVKELSSFSEICDLVPLQGYYPVYQCNPPSVVSCDSQQIVCSGGAAGRFTCGGSGQHFDCVTRQFVCQSNFTCYDFRCGSKYDCERNPVCQPQNAYTQV